MPEAQLDLSNIKQIIEACLLTASEKVTINQFNQVFDEKIDILLLEKIIGEIKEEYLGRGIELIKVLDGYRFRSLPKFQEYINKLNQIKPPKYSRSVAEILAIIAYKQPVTRGEIEEIRGVTLNSNAIQNLMDREWIEIIGYKEVPGKPALFATTKRFLEDLGLTSLQELPPLSQISEELLIEKIESNNNLVFESNQDTN